MDEKDKIIAELRQRIETLLKRIAQLEDEVARLKKNSRNSSKPPSSDIVKPNKPAAKPGRKKRNRGGQHGHKKFTRPSFKPEQVDQAFDYELTDKEADGLEPLDEWFVLQQIGLPDRMYKVIEHRARKYRDPMTGRIHIAPLPDGIRKGGLFGADMTAFVSYLKGACHMSYSTIQQFFEQGVKLNLSRGLLCKATQKVSDALGQSYDALADRLPHEPRVNIDETGHHDNGKLHWTWCFDTASYSLFKIDLSRGSGVLKDVLGKAFTGIIGADYWGAYRKYARLFDVRVQYCMAHLIREIRFLAEQSAKTLSRWGTILLDWLKKLFDTLHRREVLTAPGWRRSMERIKTAFLKQIRRPPDHPTGHLIVEQIRT